VPRVPSRVDAMACVRSDAAETIKKHPSCNRTQVRSWLRVLVACTSKSFSDG